MAVVTIMSGNAVSPASEPVHASAIELHRKTNDAGVATYRMLTGCDPADANIEMHREFDLHVLASILAMAARDGSAVHAGAGLDVEDLAALLAESFPAARDAASVWCVSAGRPDTDDDEIVMVRDLLLANRSTDGNMGRWLAAMIARRAMEANHLWEDLGLRDRSELTRLLERHFAPLAARNTKAMRWKRFFYRVLCEDDGIVMCSAPVCTQCADFDLCFGDESGESKLAQRRRTLSHEAVLSEVEAVA